ncbi:hypothetical protein F5J12DRAFT_149160 [Pisolithus orientalis]|uniref:uncharacterized protein n=1 Tax=Pisolithus orientalis TaxID=936130 RepID=UPI00222571E7|nr:uncharacterized protein F5J12DRAFT_149160 [Pisolithus orientalis]KAI6004540.1 hypothetical protein F5J12DRAFT_149160 [Pisolithus orientalis]
MLHLRLPVGGSELDITRIDVGIVGWHSRLVGGPLTTNLHDDLIFTATASNVFPALNVTVGSLAWSIHDDDDPIMTFDMHSDSTTCLGLAFRSLINILCGRRTAL